MSKLLIEHLPITAVEPNPWNPNKQTDRQFEAEIESILTNGFIAPILVRSIGDNKWQVVDGEHRMRALTIIINEKRDGKGNIPELVANAEIPAIVIDVNEASAKRLTVIMNETRGRADMAALAELLGSIADDFGDELLIGLPYTESQLQDMLKLSEFDWDSLAIPEIDDEPEKDTEHSATIQALVSPEVESLWKVFLAEKKTELPKHPKEAAGAAIGILLEFYYRNN